MQNLIPLRLELHMLSRALSRPQVGSNARRGSGEFIRPFQPFFISAC